MKVNLVLFTEHTGGIESVTDMVTVTLVHAHAILQQMDVRHDHRVLWLPPRCAPLAVMVFVAMA